MLGFLLRKRRWRWLLLLAAWVGSAASLLGPAAYDDWKDPAVFVLIVVVGLLARGPYAVTIATVCFIANPAFVGWWPRGWGGWIWRIVPFGMLLAWLPVVVYLRDSASMANGPRGDFYLGYLPWAASYTLAWAAAMIPPIRPDPASRRRGFPVVVPTTDAPGSGPSPGKGVR